MGIVPDGKDWTWVLGEPCTECGFDAASVDIGTLGDAVRANAVEWSALLESRSVARRPTDEQWSALEYACHVRDVFVLFDERLRLMIETDAPQFANWDQDITAVEERYSEQDPATVARELAAAAATIATRWDTVTVEQHGRAGFRSDGAAFTVDSFGRYFLHDPVHHVVDVRRGYQILAGEPVD